MDIARVVGSLYGFYDIDVEPMEPGRATLTARAYNRTLRFSGSSSHSVCEKFVNALIQESEKKNDK